MVLPLSALTRRSGKKGFQFRTPLDANRRFLLCFRPRRSRISLSTSNWELATTSKRKPSNTTREQGCTPSTTPNFLEVHYAKPSSIRVLRELLLLEETRRPDRKAILGTLY